MESSSLLSMIITIFHPYPPPPRKFITPYPTLEVIFIIEEVVHAIVASNAYSKRVAYCLAFMLYLWFNSNSTSPRWHQNNLAS